MKNPSSKDVKKSSSKDVKNTAALGGGVLLGSLATPAFNGAILDVVKPTSDNIKAGILLAVCVASGVGAFYIKGTGIGETLGKGALYGLAGTSGAEAIRTFAAKTPAVQKLAAKTTAVGKAVGRISGLGCACNQSHEGVMLNGTRRRRGRGMGMFIPGQNSPYPQLGSPISNDAMSNFVEQGRSAMAIY